MRRLMIMLVIVFFDHILFQSLRIKLKGCLSVQFLSLDYRLAGQSSIPYHIKGENKSFFMPSIILWAICARLLFRCGTNWAIEQFSSI
jgi:hypothetical protein